MLDKFCKQNLFDMIEFRMDNLQNSFLPTTNRNLVKTSKIKKKTNIMFNRPFLFLKRVAKF